MGKRQRLKLIPYSAALEIERGFDGERRRCFDILEIHAEIQKDAWKYYLCAAGLACKFREFRLSSFYSRSSRNCPNRLPSLDQPRNPLENKYFSVALEDAQAKHFAVFSPNRRIVSKA